MIEGSCLCRVLKKIIYLQKVISIFLPEICFLINLPNVSQNSAWKSTHFSIENFTANSEKNLPDLAANQLK